VLPVVCVIAYGEMRRCYEYFEVIPLFDLAAIANAIALKRLCEVMREILVWFMFNFMEPNFCFNWFCVTLIGCILFPALMFALARSHQCFLKVMVVTVVIVMMKE
jgi:hypothetical protein